jgi:polyhydroxyalkanoate synthase
MADMSAFSGDAFGIKDPEAFARNLSRVLEEASEAFSAYVKPRTDGRADLTAAENLTEVIKTLQAVGSYWSEHPQRALEAQQRLASAYSTLWMASIQRMMGLPATAVAAPEPGDKRFADAEWSDNPFFDFIKQFYLVTTRWAAAMVADAEGLDEHTRQKAEFYLRQISSALSPSNFVLTNPELLRQTLAENAGNLVRGMQMLAEDIRAGNGELKIRQSDASAFKVGENLGTTPGKIIHQNDLCQLIQYEATTKRVLKRPLLIVPPWINKFYILDLTAEKSFIRWAVDQGHTVFVISWVNPDERQARKSFEDYMRAGILESLDVIASATGVRDVNAIGYCVGGTLLTVTLAYMATTGDTRIKSATLFAAQIDFTHAGDLKVFVDEEQISAIERDMTARGYLDGSKMATAFNMLRPNELIWPYVVSNYLKGKAPQPFDLLYWNSDTTRMPAANHAFYLRGCYLNNALAQGRMEIGGVALDLKKVKVPVFNLATREDHIAPARSVFYGSSFLGGKTTFVLAGSGHIAGVVNPPARNKYQYWTGPAPKGDNYGQWLTKAKEHAGSWWPHWQAWIEDSDKARVKARAIGGGKIKPIEDAPGSYVRVRT